MPRFALINEKGDVLNCVQWNSPSDPWLPPKNHHVIESEEANIGDLYDFNKKTFTLWHKRADYVATQE